MKKILVILLLWIPVLTNAQSLDSLHRSKYSLNLGIGWSHYINSLELGQDNIQPDYAGVTLKFFWEPGYRVSLGLGTGYYRVFRYSLKEPDITATIDRTAIPMLLVARMRIIDRFHLSAGTGLILLRNRTSSGNVETMTSAWSLSNYEFTGSYIYPVGKRFRISGEIGTLYMGKTDDWMYFVQGVFSIIL